MFVFAATGVANGATYRMIPAIWKTQAATTGEDGSTERMMAEASVHTETSAVLGIVSAIGAMGGFLIPITFGSPWVVDPVSAVKTAFAVFAGFYVVCLVVTWAVYTRKGTQMAQAKV